MLKIRPESYLISTSLTIVALVLISHASAEETQKTKVPKTLPVVPSHWDATAWDSSSPKEFWHAPTRGQEKPSDAGNSAPSRPTPQKTPLSNTRQSEK